MFLSRSPLTARRLPVRLACIRHAASVDPEPGSNSSNNGEAGLAAGVHPRRGPCGGNARRMLHTSVGKVPGDKKASRLERALLDSCITLVVSAHRCARPCRCRQRQVYQAHSSVSSEPGRSRYLSVGGLRPRLLRTSSATTDGSIPRQGANARSFEDQFSKSLQPSTLGPPHPGTGYSQACLLSHFWTHWLPHQ